MNYLNIDITTVSSPAVIMHGVNAQRTMRSGVAKALFTRWPHVRDAYMAVELSDMRLGNIAAVSVEDRVYVINCWTQETFGYDGRIYASAEAIGSCLEQVAAFCTKVGIDNLYAPRIGCGLGGLKWDDDVQPLFLDIEKTYPNLIITICDYN